MVRIIPDKENRLSEESAADFFQIRSIAEERCIRKVGIADLETMEKIRRALATVLNLE